MAKGHRCPYCQKCTPTAVGVKRHISLSSKCFNAWQVELTRKKVGTVFDIHAKPDSRNRAPMEDITYENEDDQPSDVDMDIDLPGFMPIPASNSPDPAIVLPDVPTQRRQAPAEVCDKNYIRQKERWSESYPGGAAEILGQTKTLFEKWQDAHITNKTSEWAPFQDQHEWDLAQWLMKNIGQTSIDEYLKLPIVSKITIVVLI